jgi:hypothetical protein
MTEKSTQDSSSFDGSFSVAKEGLEIVQALKNSDVDIVQETLQLNQQFLDPFDYLHPDLAQPISDTAKAMPTAVEFVLTTLWPVLGSCIGASSKVMIKASANYFQYPIIQSVIVARTGVKKTPSQGIVIDPLRELEKEAYQRYKEDCDRYKSELAAHKNNSKPLKSAEPKPRDRYMTTDSTPEALAKIQSESHPRGLLIYRDELAGNFKSHNKYRQGKGDDEEFELALFNGFGAIKDRVSGSIFIEKSCICRTGSIQWEPLQTLMDDCQDATGMFARWLFCCTEAPPGYLDLEKEDVDLGLHQRLKSLYKKLRILPEQDYTLSDEAKLLFQKWQHQLIDLGKDESHPGLGAAYSKIESYTARFALILHCTNTALEGHIPESIIGGETMYKAIKLAIYYLSQTKLVYRVNDPGSLEDKILMWLVNFASRKNRPIDARDVKQGTRLFRDKSADDIRKYFRLAESRGLGKCKDGKFYLVSMSNADDENASVNTVNNANTIDAELGNLVRIKIERP